MTTKNRRAKDIDRALRLVWSSMESHLQWTHQKSSEGIKFHKLCCREYSELIQLLTKLY